MSTQEVTLNNGNQLNVNTDSTKIFVWNNRYSTGTSTTNSTYDDVTIPAGTLLGRVSATQIVKPLVSSASDGSQFPVGILKEDSIIPAGDSTVLTFCDEGDVVEAKVVLASGDTMATVISGRSIRDRIGADTVGIKLVGQDQLTGTDNE
jgi:hypothetical protein